MWWCAGRRWLAMADLDSVKSYYSERIYRFGATAASVDWNGTEGQLARFERFSRLFKLAPAPLSVIDYGCGYGELFRFLQPRFRLAHYVGVDAVPAMLEAARGFLGQYRGLELAHNLDSVRPAQVVVASGTYNVKLSADSGDWSDYVFDDVKALWEKAKFGLALNFLYDYSQLEKRQEKLYYASPTKTIEFLMKDISLLCYLDYSYSPWEFTVTVLREA